MNASIPPYFRQFCRGLFPAVLLSFLPVLSAQHVPPGVPQQLSSADRNPEGLSKSDWSSIRAAYEAGQHAFQHIEGGWQARN